MSPELANAPRAPTLPCKGRVARLGRAGWGEPNDLRGACIFAGPAECTGWVRSVARCVSPHPARLATLRRATLPLQGRVTAVQHLASPREGSFMNSLICPSTLRGL